jgi:GMP synthase (glutamine-hydrolysing)
MSIDIHNERILILDFGSQYTQLIARRVREAGVYCEIHSFEVSSDFVENFAPNGIILSGGPETVLGQDTPSAPQIVFEIGCPVLGICYGMQTMAAQLGGEVEAATHREYGYAQVQVQGQSDLLHSIEDKVSKTGAPLLDVWMSHGDRVISLPKGFNCIASTANAPLAGMGDEQRHFYGLQFHPEVTHTQQGQRIIARFVLDICGCQSLWNPTTIISDSITRIVEQVGTEEVILGLSGGVDSSVVAALLHQAIGQQLTCVFVDTGLLRHQEVEQVLTTFQQHMGVKVIHVDAKEQFLSALKGISDPEAKRKIIGFEFIQVFERDRYQCSGFCRRRVSGL